MFRWLNRSRPNTEIENRLRNEPRFRQLQKYCRGTDSKYRLAEAVKETRFVVIDTETTGFHAYADDRIVSIALLEMQGLILTDKRFTSLVNPGRAIPPESTAIHHIVDADVSDAPLLEDIMIDVVEFLGDSVLIGHHLDFDLRFLNRELKRLVDCQLQNPEIDTMLLFLGYTGQIGHYTLEEVARHRKIDIQGRHTAEGDALIAANAFASLASKMVDASEPVSRLIRHQGISQTF
jgi:DNA polymerase-3 subunit epsilon